MRKKKGFDKFGKNTMDILNQSRQLFLSPPAKGYGLKPYKRCGF
jgi:hypothetical protein